MRPDVRDKIGYDEPVTRFTKRVPYILQAVPAASCLYVGLNWASFRLKKEKKPREFLDCVTACRTESASE
jgi:hypothetical protein